MISGAFITEWSQHCPWISLAQVEQDLVLSRALVEIYSEPDLAKNLVFRGGTCLHKLILQPAARYSEDLDFVQIHQEPIGPTINLLRSKLEPWLGAPKVNTGAQGTTLIFRFASETPPIVALRLKIEINTREHFRVLPLRDCEFEVASRWFEGSVRMPVYAVSELLGTKLRALFQRRKGRDLFDLWHAYRSGVLDPAEVVPVFRRYMAEEKLTVPQSTFRENLEAKMKFKAFLSDTPPLLRPGVEYDPMAAFNYVDTELLSLLD